MSARVIYCSRQTRNNLSNVIEVYAIILHTRPKGHFQKYRVFLGTKYAASSNSKENISRLQWVRADPVCGITTDKAQSKTRSTSLNRPLAPGT